MLLAALPMTSFAQKKKELNPWIDCGIGAMIFDETGWAAVVSNVIWDLGTTAVTSDQMSQNTCNSKKAQTALYIGVNYASLTEESAKGDGKHLQAMLDVMGCESASRGAVIASVRSGLGQHLSSPDYLQKSTAAKAEEFYNIVTASSQCRI
jgi:hypothetical protein